jgi:hypothetical protein
MDRIDFTAQNRHPAVNEENQRQPHVSGPVIAARAFGAEGEHPERGEVTVIGDDDENG